MRRAGGWAAGAAVGVGVVLRALCFFHYRLDSDEPQHLHVAWQWTQGLLQYRDFFDNHAPLFHMTMAPILALVGERADAPIWMRAPMLVFFAVVVGVTYILGRKLWSHDVGLWAAITLALFPPFFLKSLEFRTDNLWNALWMIALLLIVSGRWRLAAGVILGLALCVSMKTILLIVTLGAAALLTRGIRMNPIGIPIAPAILAWYFHIKGAWPQLVYCVFTFNTRGTTPSPFRFVYPIAIAAMVWIAWRYRERFDKEKFFLAVAAAIFVITLVCFWTLISPRDYLPVMPIAALFLVAKLPRAATIGLCAIFIGTICYYAKPLVNQTDEHITMLNQVLGMTRTGEPLMDYKGETIFRRRPFYFIFEKIGREQVRSGAIQDTIPESIIATRCHAAQADGPFWPPRGREFMVKNFLDMGRIRASGQWIGDDGNFTIAVPGEYIVVDANGIASGTLDASPQTAARTLEQGSHHFERAHDGPLAVMWAPAFRRGYSPFHLRDREF